MSTGTCEPHVWALPYNQPPIYADEKLSAKSGEADPAIRSKVTASLKEDPAYRTAAASLILCGHPILEKTLVLDIHSAIKTRIAAQLYLKPLQEKEVSEFIR